MKKTLKAYLSLESLENLMLFISAVLITLMFTMTIIDVVGRYFFSRPLPDSYALLSLMLMPFAFMGFSYAQRQKLHVAIEIVMERLKPKAQMFMQIIWFFVQLVVSIYGTYACWVNTARSFQSGEMMNGLLYIPVAPFKCLVVFGFFIMCLRLAVQFVTEIKKYAKGDYTGYVSSDDPV
jgi:TRAP-type C4-dicarboxylate transport system permease small subunit